jgi:hypothetical protein
MSKRWPPLIFDRCPTVRRAEEFAKIGGLKVLASRLKPPPTKSCEQSGTQLFLVTG